MRRNSAAGHSEGDKPLTLKITDFGPIASGTVTTKPLTVLVGPNGCGKSHVATLAYAIMRAESVSVTGSFGMPEQKQLNFYDNLAKRISAQYAPDSKNILDSDTHKIFVQYIVNNFSHLLSRIFLMERKKLIRIGKTHFELDITSEIIDGKIQFAIDDDDPKFKERESKRIKVIFKKGAVLIPSLRINGDTFEVSMPYFEKIDRQELFRAISLGMRDTTAFRSTKRGIYFPAERGGLVMAQRSLTLHYYNMRENVHISPPDPNLSNVATNFLGMLLTTARDESEFADLATKFEARAMEGTVAIRDGPNNMLDIIFKQHNEEFPLNASASSIKDLAPFLLYLKHVAKCSDVVILEEPETCLHPTNQILLARLLAQLVNRGMNIIVTTHGPFFLEQLSNCVMAGENRNGKSGPILAEEQLKKDNVAAYNFVSDKDGYKIEELEVDDEGIPQYEFTKVYDQLYDELLELERD